MQIVWTKSSKDKLDTASAFPLPILRVNKEDTRMGPTTIRLDCIAENLDPLKVIRLSSLWNYVLSEPNSTFCLHLVYVDPVLMEKTQISYEVHSFDFIDMVRDNYYGLQTYAAGEKPIIQLTLVLKP